MRFIGVLVGALLVSAPAFADRPEPIRPAVLDCVAPGATAPADKFRLEAFDTKKPETNLDARIDGEIAVDSMQTSFSANNGCDNNYDFVFVTDDLDELARGQRKSVVGLMHYFNADLYYDMPDMPGTETVAITCTVGVNAPSSSEPAPAPSSSR